MSYSWNSRSILMILAFLLAASFLVGSLWPEPGGAFAPAGESPIPVSSIPVDNPVSPVYYQDRAVVLTYHNLGLQEASATISPERFREHLEGLKKLGYNFIPLQQLCDFLDGKAQLPPNAVLITFDDGYASVWDYGRPILQAEGVPASVFMIVRYIGADQGQIPKLTWFEMEEMQAEGISFGSHSYDSHVMLKDQQGQPAPALLTQAFLADSSRYETPSEYRDRIASDLMAARDILENGLGRTVDCLALPFGASDPTVRAVAGQAGYRYIFNSDPGLVEAGSDRMALHRFNAGQGGTRSADLHAMILKKVQRF